MLLVCSPMQAEHGSTAAPRPQRTLRRLKAELPHSWGHEEAEEEAEG